MIELSCGAAGRAAVGRGGALGRNPSVPLLPMLPTDPLLAVTSQVLKGLNPCVDSYSAFYDNMKLTDTGLLGKLRALGVTHVYCVGIAFDYW